jgi:hypothetical protein
MTNVSLTLKSVNKKTGPIPVSTTGADTCPPACPLKNNGCYAENMPLRGRWQEVTDGTRKAANWSTFCDMIAALPAGQLWRHNQAGDLPGEGDAINLRELKQLVKANKGRRGFTYTHKPVTGNTLTAIGNNLAIDNANYAGFTINLSANNLTHADELVALDIAPVVTVLPSSIHGNVKVETPAGNRVVVCPATYRDDVTCKTCGLCQIADRKVIVGFPAHGISAKKADVIAKGE